MQEDLLGYLLGALDEEEMRRISALLKEDPELREQLESLKNTTDILENAYVPVEPPSTDLVSRTLDLIDEQADSCPGASSADVKFLTVPNESDQETALVAEVGLSVPTSEIGHPSTSRWIDWLGAAVAASIILCIVLPALANGRFEARKAACQDQLRRLGVALTQFVSRAPEHRLPAVAESGPEAFAGIYALRLNESGLIPDGEIRWCPSIQPPDFDDSSLVNLGEVGSLARLRQAPVNDLQEIQKLAGGHYAYNLGVIVNDRYTSPRFEGRTSFAVMSDAPLIGNLGASELGDSDRLSQWIGHGGRGINILFEDGRVAFTDADAIQSLPDHPLLNHQGKVEAGVNIDDASLAPSWRPPFLDVPQR